MERVVPNALLAPSASNVGNVSQRVRDNAFHLEPMDRFRSCLPEFQIKINPLAYCRSIIAGPSSVNVKVTSTVISRFSVSVTLQIVVPR